MLAVRITEEIFQEALNFLKRKLDKTVDSEGKIHSVSTVKVIEIRETSRTLIAAKYPILRDTIPISPNDAD